MSTDEVQQAKSELSALIAKNPEEILGCAGKTLEEAQKTLRALQEQKAA